MLKIGLTGGIASGKSLVATRLKELGAILVDADVLARDVVAPGTAGLDRVVREFGHGVLTAEGTLDRPALGRIVFAEPEQREVLNGIIHPLVRARAAAILSEAAPGDIVVQDIPLLVETGQGDAFHLVVVVDAPDELRLDRMVRLRGMEPQDAMARMAAQASRDQRLAAADVVLDNSGSVESLLALVDSLWTQRLVPFTDNLLRQVRADRSGPAVLVPPDPSWPAQAERIAGRLRAAVGHAAVAIDHIGSTAVPGLPAKDVLDLQLTVKDLDDADRIAPLLVAAGFPRQKGAEQDTPKAPDFDAGSWQKRFHANADPGRAVNLHVRKVGSPGWRYALLFRDWLRANPDAVAAYLAEKQRLMQLHQGESSTHAYASAKEAWFTDVAFPAMNSWAAQSGWKTPSYS
ncbi:dephospho-CoA kinase [Arthrobacter sp. M4]|uniref:dephospho-CoA kinase n=1 Tax=Arthrobacter sp. M4 TaxID=218160 RepID=UPI001CDCD509|nr:dephospho-CoA kinase [Arthrobacter sp. M4]MCA4131551.1 dephospho-CoA kinase [Arthrobacter sp. M4]